LGYYSEWQLAKITDHKEQAQIRKQPAGSHSDQEAPLPGQQFLMDFGFM
jgi:hypothetical protein